MSTSRFMLGLLAGVAIGMLIAPEKGENLRHGIADTADKWKDRLNRMVGRAGARLDDLRSLLEKNIDGLTEEVRNRIMTIIDEESPRRGVGEFAGSKNGQMGY